MKRKQLFFITGASLLVAAIILLPLREWLDVFTDRVEDLGWAGMALFVLMYALSPVFPYVALNYLLGLTGVKFWPYTLASWIGMLPGTLL